MLHKYMSFKRNKRRLLFLGGRTMSDLDNKASKLLQPK